MLSTYAAVFVLAVLAAILPAGMFLLNALLAPKVFQSDVKLTNYESAAKPIGTHRDVSNEYVAYFPIYLSMELVIIAVLAWSIFSAGSKGMIFPIAYLAIALPFVFIARQIIASG